MTNTFYQEERCPRSHQAIERQAIVVTLASWQHRYGGDYDAYLMGAVRRFPHLRGCRRSP